MDCQTFNRWTGLISLVTFIILCIKTEHDPVQISIGLLFVCVSFGGSETITNILSVWKGK